MAKIHALFHNPWVLAFIGGAVTVILVWGYTVFQKTSIQSLQIARGGELTDEEQLSLQMYESPPLIPCFALGAIVSYLSWYVLAGSGATIPLMTAAVTTSASDVVMQTASLAPAAVPTLSAAVAAVAEPVSAALTAIKNTVAPEPVIRNGMAGF